MTTLWQQNAAIAVYGARAELLRAYRDARTNRQLHLSAWRRTRLACCDSLLVPQLAKVTSFPAVGFDQRRNLGVVADVPLIVWADYRGAGPVWYSVTCFAVMVVGSAFLFAWMRLKSGSVWTGMLLHASHNFSFRVFLTPKRSMGNLRICGRPSSARVSRSWGSCWRSCATCKRSELPVATA